MNKDTKVLLMAIVIILVAIVSFNLSDLTGMVSSDITILTVSPITVSFEKYDAAKMITIRVSPSKDGIDKRIIMRKCKTEKCDSSMQISSETANICTNSLCYDEVTISYRINSGLKSGWYFLEAEREKTDKKFVSNIFEIRHI